MTIKDPFDKSVQLPNLLQSTMAKLIQVFVFAVLLIAWSANYVTSQSASNDVDNETATMTTEEMEATEPTRPRTTTPGGIGGFFKKIGAELNKSGRVIQESVNNSTSFLRKGFGIVRDSIVPTKETITTTTESSTLSEVNTDLDPVENDNNTIPPTMTSGTMMSDDHHQEEEDDRPIWDVVEDKKEIEMTTEVLDNRFLIDAPTFCPVGQMKLKNGQCRTVS